MRSLIYKNKIWTFYKWMLFLVMLDSLRVWFFWLVPIPFLTSMLFIVISAFVVAVSPQLFFFNRKTVFLFFFFYLMARFFGTRGNMNAYLGMFLTSVSIFIFLGLKDEYKIDFLSFFTKVFAILMAISLSAWILVIWVLICLLFEYFGFSERRNELKILTKTICFLIDFRFRDSMMLPRFNSVLEPGYLSIILVILLSIKFNMKNKYNIIMLVALFFTFSLAGWLLFMFVYIAYLLRNSRFKIEQYLYNNWLCLFFLFSVSITMEII